MSAPDLAAARREAEEALKKWMDSTFTKDGMPLARALRSLLAATAPAPSSPPGAGEEGEK